MALPRFDTAQLTLFRTPFNDPDFIFELKMDGFRGLAYIDDGVCELVSRRRNPYKSFKELQDSLGKLKVRNAIIDGEIACVDEEGGVRPPKISVASAASSMSASSATTMLCNGTAAVSKSRRNQNASASPMPRFSSANHFEGASRSTTETASFIMRTNNEVTLSSGR